MANALAAAATAKINASPAETIMLKRRYADCNIKAAAQAAQDGVMHEKGFNADALHIVIEAHGKILHRGNVPGRSVTKIQRGKGMTYSAPRAIAMLSYQGLLEPNTTTRAPNITSSSPASATARYNQICTSNGDARDIT